MTLPKYYIPITNNINEFRSYLDSTDRAILSARFGDGKSTFLNEFCEKSKRKYIAITINPLHYQVADNKDIFEYIKRDILLQTLSYTELEESTYSNWLMLYSYIQSNSLDIIDDIIDSVPDVNIEGVSTEIIKKPLQNLIKNIRKFREHKTEIHDQTEEKTAKNFIDAFKNSKGSIYEFDAVTQLICSINREIQEKEKKKMVLIVEDLDRIDPAHIFRILNILSAHIERNQQGLTEWNTTYGNNKFLFDKILLVCDYNNIKSIFHHFYGERTDFDGYISKFTSHKPYYFSLRDRYKDFILQRFDKDLMRYPDVMSVVADLIIEKEINTKEKEQTILRNIDKLLVNKYPMVNNENIPIEVENENRAIVSGYKISTLNNLTKLLDILRRFSITYHQLWTAINDKKVIDELYRLIGVCWLINVNDELFCELKINPYIISASLKGFSMSRSTDANVKLDTHCIVDIEFNVDIITIKLNNRQIIENLPKIVSKMNGYLINNAKIVIDNNNVNKSKKRGVSIPY